jgi:hypothetical protein
MLVPNERRELKCFRCQKVVDSACGGYWFLLLAPRGRVHFPAAPSRKLDMSEPSIAESVLCAFCGRQLREYLEEGAYAPGEAYERIGKSNRPGVHGSSDTGTDRGARSSDVVDTAQRSAEAGVQGFQRVGELVSSFVD